MAIFLALAAAMSWGSSDFVAGVASRRTSGLSVVIAAHATGLVLLVTMLPLVMVDSVPSLSALGWGALAGICGGAGAALLYRGLAIGRMGVVAPVTAATAAAVPTIAGLALDSSIAPLALLGIGLAFVAVVLVALPGPDNADSPAPPATARPGGAHRRIRTDFAARKALIVRQALCQPGVPEALLSGVGFGGFYLFLERAPESSGLWPLVGARLASVVLLALFAIATRRLVLPPKEARPGCIGVGVLDVVAASLYLLATRNGPLAVVAVLASFYPIATVGLARGFDGERCHRWQLVGLGVAGAAVALLSVS